MHYASRAMTTCLAVICNHNQSIVTVSDTKFSYGYTSGTGTKAYLLHRDWNVLFAGSVSKCSMAIKSARKAVDHLPKTTEDMVHILTAACVQHPCATGEDRTLLLVGFDGVDRQPHVYVIADDPERKQPRVDCYDEDGYAAIGSGQFIATHMLTLYGQHPNRNLQDSVYICCATKFFSERASDVGADTEVYVFHRGGVDMRVRASLPQIRRAWEHSGQLPVPKSITRKIEKRLSSFARLPGERPKHREA